MASKHGIQPLFDYVLIKPAKQDEVTASGIVLPESAVKEKPQMGEVMAVGEGFGSDDGRENKIIVKVGQKVLYKKWGGNEIKVGNEEWMLLEQKDIMAIVA
ncbi:MAG TPA: co-chaperone GroES [Candidatus Woesebacteria bacterium]|nr:co-chaperone GroES [Candidatus Woesebacteria bacterium]